jgi:hypothetical protein
MKFSPSALVAIAIAITAPAYAAVVARVEGEITGRAPSTVGVLDRTHYYLLLTIFS